MTIRCISASGIVYNAHLTDVCTMTKKLIRIIMERFQLMMLSINKVVRSGRAHRASAICSVRLDDCFRKSLVVLNPTNASRRDKIIRKK